MGERLELYTLGGLTISRDGEPLSGFDSRKGPALLVYLASTRRAHAREVLAEMLWEERAQAQALANLRVTLTDLRHKLDPFIEITRDTVTVLPEADIWLDTVEVEQGLLQSERALAESMAPQEVIQRLEAVRTLYRGDFLEGFYVESRAYNDWALLERERLRFSIMHALDRLVETYSREGDTRAGLDCVARLAQIDPLREKTYRQAMRLLAQSGQREAAMHQYDLCAHTLRHELGVIPSPETVELYEAIRNGASLMAPPTSIDPRLRQRRSSLPALPTTFIGREVELLTLQDRIDDPHCRLLTIVGPGGIGKTRLALEVTRRVRTHFADGVFVTALDSVRSAEAIVPALIAGLCLDVPEGQTDLLNYLIDSLAGKALLLMVDNAEHLVGQLDVLERILAEAPGVKLLVTSREPLALPWEWVFTLGGMAVPERVDVENSEAYGSVRLFLDRARRVQHRFTLADDPAGVIRICQQVEGMPLGIELAAAWLRVMSCQEIAAQLVDLQTPYQSVEPRHQSLRALFDNTWARQNDHERRVLMGLAVFRGGFTASAAEAVTGCSLPDLATLVRRSLIVVNHRNNRYYIHQLLGEFLRKKPHAQPAVEQAVLDRHCAHFVDFLQAHETALKGDAQRQTLGEIQADIDNVRAAWQYALGRRRFDCLVRASPSLSYFYLMKVLHREALGVFQAALAGLVEEPETPERDRQELALQACLMAPLIAIYGWEDRRLWPVAERMRDLAARLGDDLQALTSTVTLVNLLVNEEWERAIEIGLEALPLARQVGREAENAIHVALEIPGIFTGRHAFALEHARAAIALFDPDECLWSTMAYGTDPLVISLSHAGLALAFLGYPEQGIQSVQAALRRAEALAQPFAQAFAWSFEAQIYLLTRKNALAKSVGQRLVDISAVHGFSHWAIFGPCFMAVAQIQQGHYAAGIVELVPAIQRERSVGLTHNLPSWHAYLGYAYAMTGHLDQGLGELEKGIAVMERVGERQHEPLVCRLKGELLRLLGDEAGAEALIEQAIAVAQRQESKFYELQAMLSLARLLQSQDRRAEARPRLESLVGWFTEGFDCPDLVEARALLAELG